jgi:hypothetical protein
MGDIEILLLEKVSYRNCLEILLCIEFNSYTMPYLMLKRICIILGFSNISVYISSKNDIEESEILKLQNLTTLRDSMEGRDYREELKKFTTKYPLCGSYNRIPTLKDIVIDIDCQFPFEVRYVLLHKDSNFEPSSLTLNDIQFKLKGK